MSTTQMKCPRCWGSKFEPGKRSKCTFCGGTGTAQDRQISEYFWLSEMLKSDTALRKGIPNNPEPWQIQHIENLCRNFLDPVRKQFGPLRINSGLRLPAVNVAIGGSEASAHMEGAAADFVPVTPGVGLKQVAVWIVANKQKLKYDQVIYEGTWIHLGALSPAGKVRGQDLMMFPVNGKAKYYPFNAGDQRVI